MRPFRDSDVEVGIRWYAVPWGSPILPYESVIVSQDWDAEPWVRSGVGEVYATPRNFAGWTRPALPGAGHICGTPEDFKYGGEYRPDLDPVGYTNAGLPVCCLDGVGVQVGGQGAYVAAGGVVIGGQFEAATHPGGVLIGGGEWFTPVAPGTTCADAGELAESEPGVSIVTNPAFDWWKADMLAGVNTIRTTRTAGAGELRVNVFAGVCPIPLTQIAFGQDPDVVVSLFALGEDRTVWWSITSHPPPDSVSYVTEWPS